MAIYRNVHVTFWTDAKVVDDFTPEDKYFYIYLLTNPHTNLCGCYEISIKQMSDELGYNKETIEKLLDRFHKIHKILEYDAQGKEIIIYNWHKYNWTKSPKLQAALAKEIPKVKNPKFFDYLNKIINSDTVSIPYPYRMDTPDTDTDTDTDTVSDADKLQTCKHHKASKEDIDAFFETVWALYPVKKGKGQVSDAKRRALYAIGLDEMTRAINRYLQELKKDASWRKAQNGSTFFNSGHVDYLDKNYTPDERTLQNGSITSDIVKTQRVGNYI